jgi:hypothetical protein
MATFQFLICLFIIFFYTTMIADVTNVAEAITYKQFSGQMVIALFLQIIVMILDRYLYKSKTFIQIEDTAEADASRQEEGEGKAPKRRRGGEEGSIYQKIKKHIKEEESDDVSSANAEEDEHFKALEKNMKLQQTRVTFSMVAKFYMQWLLLLVVHGFVFWYFPT